MTTLACPHVDKGLHVELKDGTTLSMCADCAGEQVTYRASETARVTRAACPGCSESFKDPVGWGFRFPWGGHLRIDKTTDKPVGVCDKCEKNHSRFWRIG